MSSICPYDSCPPVGVNVNIEPHAYVLAVLCKYSNDASKLNSSEH